MSTAPRRIHAGDWNGFFGLVVDNLSILAFLAAALIGIFGVPAEIVFQRMFPGTALGVLVGNAIYTALARRLARRTGRVDVTAMPLGLDAPTSIGMALLVLGPAFLRFKAQGLDAHAAGVATWQLGMAALIAMGVLKTALSFCGDAVRRVIPRAGLLGSIAGIALMLMGFLPLVEILRVPVVGLAGLGVVFFALVARRPLPGGVPGVFGAFVVGTLLYYGLGAAGLAGPGFKWPDSLHLGITLPWPTLEFVHGFAPLVDYLPLVLPFGLLMVVGGINVTESARAAGDDYATRDILLTEAFSTLVAGVCGGVAQTTPYIGQPAYKAMGARSAYTLLTGVFVGLGGVLGYLSALVDWLPLAVLAPILVYVALSITVQAFEATPAAHWPAVALAFFPAIARLVAIKLGDPSVVAPAHFAELLAHSERGFPELAVIVVLGNGFIITSMLWAAYGAALIDGRSGRAAAWLVACAALTAVGVIHSVDPNGAVYLPWNLPALPQALAWQFAAAYLVLAALTALLGAATKTATAAPPSRPG